MNQKQPPLRQMMYRKAAKMKVPISGTFELTPLCNMNCKMCYIRMSPEEMRTRGRELSAARWVQLGRECRDQGMLFLLLTGGEPFLRPDFREIYTELQKMGMLISINTNGTLLDEETVRWLAQMPPMRVNVTLYGGSNETYERLCGNPRGYDQATRGIRLLKEAGIVVVLNASFTRINAEDLDAIYDFAQELDIPVRPAMYMFPPVRNARDGRVDAETRFSPEEAGEILFRTKERSLSPGDMAELCQRVCQGLPTELEDEECARTADEHMGCMAGRSAFWVTWDGRMTPCGMMNIPVTKPFEDGFEACWKTLVKQVDEILLPAACSGCALRNACMVCGALALAEGEGDSTKRPDYLCGMTKAYAARCRARFLEGSK